MKEIDFLPDIDQYLEKLENSKSVSVKSLDEIVYKLMASTALSKEACEALLKLYFQEIRNAIIRGDTIDLRGFGKFYLSSPKGNNNVRRVFPKFKIHKVLKDKLNKIC